MTEAGLFNNTFDNVSLFDRIEENFMNHSPFQKKCATNLNVQPNGNAECKVSNSNVVTNVKEISLNDTLFLTESFMCKVENSDNYKTDDVNSEDMFNESQDYLKVQSASSCTVYSDRTLTNTVQNSNLPKDEVVSSGICILNKESEKLCSLVKTSTSIGDYNLEVVQKMPTHKNNAKESNACWLELWGLPDNILQKYHDKKINSMFEWQVECLSIKNVLENNANLVYSAPTSAGKTLVAEILAIKAILERKKKVLFILPFVAVVREKMFYLQEILETSGIRVEGFMGSYHPPGGFESIQVAICTIEKANNIINRLLEENKLCEIGAVVVDEMHLLGDSHRGYLLELLLTKIKYMCNKDNDVNIQIIGMSATLPNLNVLASWLDAELYTTDFRPVPLYEQVHVDFTVYDSDFKLIRRLEPHSDLGTDTDNILQLCLETISNSCSIIIFCPTKNWCENLAQQIAAAFWKLGNSKSTLGESLRVQLNSVAIMELAEQLKHCPVGLDAVLQQTVSCGVAFHHAGLTMDERDIIEGAFRSGTLRVLVATSTLSSGVNLPAQRVIIRTPVFYGKPIDPLTYRQMIGRAGRMGKDVSGESILICQKKDYCTVKKLLSAQLDPIESCLKVSGRLKRAILEVIASDVASTAEDVKLFASCTLLACSNSTAEFLANPVAEAVEFLENNEFIRLQSTDNGTVKYMATSLGKACLSSSLPPEEGLDLFGELAKARQCFVLENELHIIYLVTPYSAANQWGNLDWMSYLDIWEKLPASMKRVGELVGVRESYIIKATRSKVQTSNAQSHLMLMVHKRFYTALALQDLVNEVPLNDVAAKFNCSKGMMQSLQQSASTFAGMVTSFSHQLGWSSIEILVSQFQDRLQFGVGRELLDLMRLQILTGYRARALYNAGIQSLVDLASSDVCTLENILYMAVPFESEKKRDGETDYEAKERNKFKTVWVCGKDGLTEREAAILLISDARKYLEREMGLKNAQWSTIDASVEIVNSVTDDLQDSKCITSTTENNLQTDSHSHTVEEVNDCSSDSDGFFELHLSPDNETNTIEQIASILDAPDSNESLFDESVSSDFDSNLQHVVNKELNGRIGESSSSRKRKNSDDFIASSQDDDEQLCYATRKNRKEIDNVSNGRYAYTPSKKRNMQMDIASDLESESVDIQELEIIDVCTDAKLFKTFFAELENQQVLSVSVACSEAKVLNPAIGSKIIGQEVAKQSKVIPEVRELNYKNTKIDGLAVTWGGNVVYYINLTDGNISQNEKLKLIQHSVFGNMKTTRIFDAKEQMKLLKFCCNLKMDCFVEDPKVADWMLQPEDNDKSLLTMALTYSPNIVKLSQLTGSCKGVGSVGLNHQNFLNPRLRACIEATVTWYLVPSVRNVLIKQNYKLLEVYDTETKTLRCLADMEVNGLGICKKSLQDFANNLKELLIALERQANSLAGQKVSLASSKQVAKAIGLYKGKRISLNKQTLQDNDNPISSIVIHWRKLNSILTKIVYPLLQVIKNDRIYPCCITHNATGRITMHEPNVQNVARNFEMVNPASQEIVQISCRSAFKSAEGYILLSADYCQLELRILTHLSEDKLLCSIMKSEEDVFRSIAAKWNNISEEEVNDTLRQQAKQICYGVIYGMGAKTLSKQLGVTEEDALQFIETFYKRYISIKEYVKKVINECKKNEYVETILGRRRYLPNINHRSPAIKSQAERQAVNTTIQGSAADIAKRAMTLIADHFAEISENMPKKPRLVLHLHDELLYEVPSECLQLVADIVKTTMETCINLSVPLPVKLKSGFSWGTLEEF